MHHYNHVDLQKRPSIYILFSFFLKGDRSQKIGVVNDQYVVHYGIPSLGGQSEKVNIFMYVSNKCCNTKTFFYQYWAGKQHLHVHVLIKWCNTETFFMMNLRLNNIWFSLWDFLKFAMHILTLFSCPFWCV